MLVTPATADDSSPIAELLAQLGYPTDSADIPGRLGAVVAADGAVLLLRPVATEPPIGLVALQSYPVIHRPGLTAYITALVVSPGARGVGAGRALLTAAERWARERGCDRLAVTSAEHRDGAHHFYPRSGLPYTGRRYSRSLDG